ncbi:hypothetical protein BCR34DRAFT_580245 [Clohesyomyces aquaticus]|uniref:Uncharacterized protein n=1 Tax=Clohesyomyces aquaticus TaxID=1231657 RepID=A0A1Y1Y7J4_9PLEO|nr:hypothetical protein BCR34DRAFT_580245 [Clohesyomyces aquaticus]
MNLDTPALSPSLQSSTYTFLNHLISTSLPVASRTHATILLTHIPLHKPAGICVDSPFFDFFTPEQDPAYAGGVKEQNMLSEHASKSILEGIFGLSGDERAEGNGRGRYGVIVNGHDHEGCDILHYYPRDGDTCSSTSESSSSSSSENENENENEQSQHPSYRTLRLPTSPSRPNDPLVPLNGNPCLPQPATPQLREITLRSMMGEFGGYAGFLSAWFEEGVGERGEWRIEFRTCGFAVQHWWWTVHVLDLIWGVCLVASFAVWGWGKVVEKDRERGAGKEGKEKEKERDAHIRVREPEAVNTKEKPLSTLPSPPSPPSPPPPAQSDSTYLCGPQALDI